MKTRRIATALAALALIAVLAGCTPAKAVTTGSFDGTAYSNDYFGMTFRVPEGWTIASKEEMQTIFQTGAEAIGSDDKDLEKTLKLAQQKTLYLAYASKHPLDYVEGTNPNINVVCENLSLMGLAIKTGKDYAEIGIEKWKQTIPDSMFSDIRTEKIGGVEFAAYDVAWTMQGITITQQQYCCVKKNYAIAFTLTFFDDLERNELKGIVDTVKLD